MVKSKPSRNKREKVAATEFQQSLLSQRKDDQLQSKADEDLFVVDTVVIDDRRKRKRDPKPPKPGPKNKDLPKMNQVPKTKVPPVETVADIWDNAAIKTSSKKEEMKKKQKKSRLTPAHAKPTPSHPGMSYNPDVSDHQDIIAAAVAVELRRNEAKEMIQDPLWAKIKNKSYLDHESEDEEENDTSSSEEEEEERNVRNVEKRSNKGRLTRAEKNRRNRHKQTLTQQTQAKKHQQLLAEIASAKKISKELALKDIEAKETARAKKEEGVNPLLSFEEVSNKLMHHNAHVHAPEVTVPLSDELSGSLRSLKTKNSVILEQLAVKQFALDPQLKVKRILRPDSQKKAHQVKKKLKVKTTDRYFHES